MPAAVLDSQLRRMPDAAREIGAEGWDLVTRPAEAAVEPAHSPGSRRAAVEQAERPARLGFVLQISRLPVAGRPARLARRRGRRGRRGRPGRHRADGPPDPDPAGRPGLGADSRAVGDARPAGRPAPGTAAGHAGHPGDLPRAGNPGQDRRHARRAQRRPRVLRHRRGLVGSRARGVRAALPAAGRPAATSWRWRSRRCGRCGSPVRRPTAGPGCQPARDDVLPASGIAGADHRGRQRRAPHPADRGPAGRRLQPAVRPWMSWTASSPVLREHCRDGRPRPRRGGGHRARRPGHRPRPGARRRDRREAARPDQAATFARRHHAGTAADHIGRYRLLAERGVSTVFVALPDLAGPDDVLRLAPVAAAFR